MAIDFYHNPRCTTSRKALKMLRDQGVEPNIIEYLKTPPDKARLKQLLKMMKMTPRELIEAMVANPILIERPIIVNGGQARLGRPAEKVMEIV